MLAEIKSRNASKFCCNCGALIRAVASADDIQKPEPCGDCEPWFVAIQKANEQVRLETRAIVDAGVHLDRIRDDRRKALQICIANN